MFKLITNVANIRPIRTSDIIANFLFFSYYFTSFLIRYINTGTPNKAVSEPIGVS